MPFLEKSIFGRGSLPQFEGESFRASMFYLEFPKSRMTQKAGFALWFPWKSKLENYLPSSPHISWSFDVDSLLFALNTDTSSMIHHPTRPRPCVAPRCSASYSRRVRSRFSPARLGILQLCVAILPVPGWLWRPAPRLPGTGTSTKVQFESPQFACPNGSLYFNERHYETTSETNQQW